METLRLVVSRFLQLFCKHRGALKDCRDRKVVRLACPDCGWTSPGWAIEGKR